jgi:hypothetical protein
VTSTVLPSLPLRGTVFVRPIVPRTRISEPTESNPQQSMVMSPSQAKSTGSGAWSNTGADPTYRVSAPNCVLQHGSFFPHFACVCPPGTACRLPRRTTVDPSGASCQSFVSAVGGHGGTAAGRNGHPMSVGPGSPGNQGDNGAAAGWLGHLGCGRQGRGWGCGWGRELGTARGHRWRVSAPRHGKRRPRRHRWQRRARRIRQRRSEATLVTKDFEAAADGRTSTRCCPWRSCHDLHREPSVQLLAVGRA